MHGFQHWTALLKKKQVGGIKGKVVKFTALLVEIHLQTPILHSLPIYHLSHGPADDKVPVVHFPMRVCRVFDIESRPFGGRLFSFLQC